MFQYLTNQYMLVFQQVSNDQSKKYHDFVRFMLNLKVQHVLDAH